MHVEFLVEDRSGRVLLERLLPKLLPHGVTWRVHSYRGVGHLPKDLNKHPDPAKRALLNQLPRLLKGYRNVPGIDGVVVVLDADDRPAQAFLIELRKMADACESKGTFHLAIEELEAWLLGDRKALAEAYPRARAAALDSYEQDSICGTWEVLADAIYPGGAKRLASLGYPEIGNVKIEWAGRIGALMIREHNVSPSFHAFCRGIEHLTG